MRLARQQLRFLLAETAEVDVDGRAARAPRAGTGLRRVADAGAGQPAGTRASSTSTKGIYGELVTIAKAGNKPRVDFSAGCGKRSLGL